MSSHHNKNNKTQLDKNKIGTALIHHLYDPAQNDGFINPPVIRGSTVLFPDAHTLETEDQSYIYGTHGTPTTDALCNALNFLKGAACTVLAPSGLAAITTTLLALVKQGDHLLLIDSVYGPTRRFVDQILKKFGVSIEYYPANIGANITQLFRTNTRAIFTESPCSNTFEIQDIPAICAAAHKKSIPVILDNTWATPLYFRALDHGVDISIHAATKYIGGHSDCLLGTISTNQAYAELIKKAHLSLGICVGSDDAYLILRGLRTMKIRLEHQQKTALALAQWLEQHPLIDRVLYPALKSHPEHSLWKRDFTGANSIFSIVLKKGSKQEAHKFLDHLTLFGLGYSWGGFESLAIPVNLADRTLNKGDYPGPVLRLQIGLEDQEDLRLDLEHALAAAFS